MGEEEDGSRERPGGSIYNVERDANRRVRFPRVWDREMNSKRCPASEKGARGCREGTRVVAIPKAMDIDDVLHILRVTYAR